MHNNVSKTRQFIFFSIVTIACIILLLRLAYIQIIQSHFYSSLAEKQQKIFVKLEPRRGAIYDRLNRALAIYLDVYSIYAVPREVNEKEKVAETLSKELKVSRDLISKRFGKNNYFAWIKRKVASEDADKIKKLNIEGLYLTKESKRFYPGGDLACHVLGLTGIDNQGLEGLELYYDRYLRGEYGWRNSFRDAKRREIPFLDSSGVPARDGENLVLTIDEVIQHILEKEIENLLKSYKPKAVSIVAIEPTTGEILGMAAYPTFNPNEVVGVDINSVRNRTICDLFEPGSVFKIITASAALEENIVNFDSTFFCENGRYRVRKRVLHDYKPYGTLTFREIIEKSSNIGTVKVAEKLKKDKLFTYIKRFGFGRATGIDLPGERDGIVREPSTWSYVDMSTIPMGQGIAVTTLQLVSAISVIANDGVLMRPYVVKRFLNKDGAVIKENRPKSVRRVISKKTAIGVKELLGGVIERGTGKRARLDNFRACGKTGTAEKVKPAGGYYKNKYIASFIGFAPYDSPAVALVVCVDEPKGKHFGGQVAAPAFKNIMEKVLSYLEVESDRDETKQAS